MPETTKKRRLMWTALIGLTIHVLIGASSEADVVANFTFSPPNPVVGQEVQFTDTSTGNPTSWQWDFQNPPNGIDSTEQNPTWTFDDPGTYPVTLIASVPPLDIDEVTINVVVEFCDPGELSFTMSSYEVNEDVGGATIPVRRTGGSCGAVSVRCDTADGTATAGEDYTATMDTLSWADGDTANKACTVPIIDDDEAEGSETVVLSLTNPTGGAILGTPSTAILTILDDDMNGPSELSFTMSSYNVNEGEAEASIAVQRTGGSDGAVSVRCDTSNGTATAGEDYIETMDTLSWADGDTGDKLCTVPILDDSEVEADETVMLSLTNFTGGAGPGDPITAILTIIDDIFTDGFESGDTSAWSNAVPPAESESPPLEGIVLRVLRDSPADCGPVQLAPVVETGGTIRLKLVSRDTLHLTLSRADAVVLVRDASAGAGDVIEIAGLELAPYELKVTVGKLPATRFSVELAAAVSCAAFEIAP